MGTFARAPVVVGVDGSVESRAAVDLGAWEAHRRGVALRLVHVRDPCPGTGRTFVAARDGRTPFERADALLRKESDRVGGHYGELTTVPLVAVGDPSRLLLAESAGAALVLVGFRGLGSWYSRMLGSVSTALLANCPAPLIVVRPAPRARFGVVAVVEGADDPDAVLEFGYDEAGAWGMDLTVADTVPAESGDDPVRALVELSAEAGLLVVGRHCPGCDALVRNALVPVAVVPDRPVTATAAVPPAEYAAVRPG